MIGVKREKIIKMQSAVMSLQSAAINDLLMLLMNYAMDKEIDSTGFREKIKQASMLNEEIERIERVAKNDEHEHNDLKRRDNHPKRLGGANRQRSIIGKQKAAGKQSGHRGPAGHRPRYGLSGKSPIQPEWIWNVKNLSDRTYRRNNRWRDGSGSQGKEPVH